MSDFVRHIYKLYDSLKDDTENLNGHLENISLTNNKTGKAENRLE